MLTAMILAHLIGDYVLQWDRLARWKSVSVIGATVHGLVVLAVTLICAWLTDPTWWPWALGIGLSHLMIDAVQPVFIKPSPRQPGWFALARLVVDQTLHFIMIGLALTGSGVLAWPLAGETLYSALQEQRAAVFVIAYVAITMPAWVAIEFSVYALINGSAPDLSRALRHKYIGSLERALIITFVLLGQYAFIPLVILPRLLHEVQQPWGQAAGATGALHWATDKTYLVYVAETLTSALVALLIGCALRAF